MLVLAASTSLVGCHELAYFHLVGTIGLGICLGFQLLAGTQDSVSLLENAIFFCWKCCSVTMTYVYELNRAPQNTFRLCRSFFVVAVDVDEFCHDVVFQQTKVFIAISFL